MEESGGPEVGGAEMATGVVPCVLACCGRRKGGDDIGGEAGVRT